MPIAWSSRTVRRDGVDLAVFDTGGDGPVVLFVHGYPDTHVVWERMVERLGTRFRCVAYDVRGAGDSDAPRRRDDYRLAELRADLATIVDEVSPDSAVHLVGHDWGSIQCWDAVIRIRSDPAWARRIASYTSISGPCLQHVRHFHRQSWYVLAFHLPWLPEQILPRLHRRLLRSRDRSTIHFADSLPYDGVHGLELYRANIFHREPLEGPPSTDVPVLLVVPTRDRYVTPAMTADVGQYASDLTRVEVDAGHWAPWSRPDELARTIEEFVAGHPSR